MRFVLFVCLSVLLAACSSVPSQSNFPQTYQPKMQAAYHWQWFAEKVAQEQVLPLFVKPGSSKHPKSPIVRERVQPVYIQQSDQSPFGTAFRTYMTMVLRNKGVPVVDSQDGALKLGWSIQLVNHNRSEINPPPPGVIATAGVVLGWLVAGASPGHFCESVPHTEIMITCEISQGGLTNLSQQTYTFYIPDEDADNYYGYNMVTYYVRQGSLVCRSQDALVRALKAKDEGDSKRLNAIIECDDCRIMSKDYPVNILNDDGKFLLIKPPSYPLTFVAERQSVKGY
ncbi:MAG TPA: hypothetical protein PK250_10445 [Syntrophobacter fumaroxidans]|nr:hypothetical protein [Syntrophobacter fumaroxidans]